MDIIGHLGAIARTVRHTEHNGKPAHVVVASRQYTTTIADLWEAITSAERIPRWFLPISGELTLGGRYQLQGNAGGEITACNAPTQLSVTWEFGGQTTWVNVNLSATSDETTLLELEHIAHIPAEMWDQYGPGAVGVGWDLTLMGLDKHLTSRVDKVPAEAMAWMGSAEGKSFMRGSSDAWRVASIKSGTPEDAANAAASRTSTAYAGEA